MQKMEVTLISRRERPGQSESANGVVAEIHGHEDARALATVEKTRVRADEQKVRIDVMEHFGGHASQDQLFQSARCVGPHRDEVRFPGFGLFGNSFERFVATVERRFDPHPGRSFARELLELAGRLLSRLHDVLFEHASELFPVADTRVWRRREYRYGGRETVQKMQTGRTTGGEGQALREGFRRRGRKIGRDQNFL